MIRVERERRILEIVDKVVVASIRDLAVRLGGVSEVTVRRDVVQLAARGLLSRSHGGVARIDRPARASSTRESAAFEPLLEDVQGIILPPLEGRGAETLRLMARRRRIPFLAESAPQVGGVYLGPDNFVAGYDLGVLAGRTLAGHTKKAKILLVAQEALSNTRMRCDGFLKGFTESFKGNVQHWRVDGRGEFKHALRASLDALEAQPGINVLFGVNDHSILAAIEASKRLGLDGVRGFSVGGEGGALFDVLVDGRKLEACCALFPEVVGRRAVEVLAAALRGGKMPDEVRTPHAVMTRESLGQFYQRDETGWVFAPSTGTPVAGDTAAAQLPARATRGQRRRIGFVPHYPAHDWYRCMEKAIRSRAEDLGLDLIVAAPSEGIAQEIRAMRKMIAHAAARTIAPGDTVLMNHGEACVLLAEELKSASDITVVTNSLDVLERLSGAQGIKVILTSGELHPKYRCLVGPSVGALFETLRVDKTFIAVDGVSARFGASAIDERMALAAHRFINASRDVHVLADHSQVGQEANHRIAPLDHIDEIITDTGSLPVDRLAFASAGTSVSLADEVMEAKDERPTYRAVELLVERKETGPDALMGGNYMRKIVLLAALCGIALPATGHAEDVVLKFWDNQQTESGLSQYQKEAVKRFESENPDIKVEVTTIPYPEYQQRLLTAVQGNNAPDVATLDQIWVAAFAKAGAIEQLGDRAKKAGISADTFFKGAWDSANYEDHLWGIPFNVDVWYFNYYNARALQGCGHRPGEHRDLEGPEGGGRQAHGFVEGALRDRPLRPQGGGHHRHPRLLHILQWRPRSQRRRLLRADGRQIRRGPQIPAIAGPRCAQGHSQRLLGRHARTLPERIAGDGDVAGAGTAHFAEVEARLGFRRRHRAGRQDTDRHLWRLEPGALQDVRSTRKPPGNSSSS